MAKSKLMDQLKALTKAGNYDQADQLVRGSGIAGSENFSFERPGTQAYNTGITGGNRDELIQKINALVSADPEYKQAVASGMDPKQALSYAVNRAQTSMGMDSSSRSRLNNDINLGNGQLDEKGWWGRHKALGTAALVGGAMAGGVGLAAMAGGAPAVAGGGMTAAGGAAPIGGTSLATGSSALGGGLGVGGGLAPAASAIPGAIGGTAVTGGAGTGTSLMSKIGSLAKNGEAISKGLGGASQAAAANRGTQAELGLDMNRDLESQLINREEEKRKAQSQAYRNAVMGDMALNWKPANRPSGIPTISYGGGLSDQGKQASKALMGQAINRLNAPDLMQGQNGLQPYRDLNKDEDFRKNLKPGLWEKISGVGSAVMPIVSSYYGGK